MLDYGLTVQPYIIAVGPTLSEINTCYTIVDDLMYKIPSPLQALDTCFKIFHVLHATYPLESEHIWLIIQKSIYGFDTKWDKKIPSVNTFVANIGKI